MDKVRAALAAFIQCPDADCLAPISNATIGVGTVFANLDLKPGDEILINDHEYPACQNNARRIAAKVRGQGRRRDAPVSLPFTGGDRRRDPRKGHASHTAGPDQPRHQPDGPCDARWDSGPRVVRRGSVMVIVDGAHAPGMVPIDLAALRPTYYTANCHKWICSPKGSAFMWVDFKEREFGSFRPLVLSNNAEKPKPGRDQFLTEFDYVGTQDYTSIYAIPDAIAFMASLVPGGWPEIMARNHALVLKGRDIICNALDIQPTAPDSMVGSICTMVLPAHPPELQAKLSARPTRYSDALQDALLARHRIQVPIWGIPSRPSAGRFIRISAQLYNTPEQYEYLASALKEELAAEARL